MICENCGHDHSADAKLTSQGYVGLVDKDGRQASERRLVNVIIMSKPKRFVGTDFTLTVDQAVALKTWRNGNVTLRFYDLQMRALTTGRSIYALAGDYVTVTP